MYGWIHTGTRTVDAAAFRLLGVHNFENRPPVAGPPVICERCGANARVEWLEVTALNDPGPVPIMGRSSCPTDGCVNEHGSTTVLPPDHPDRRLTPDDHAWKRRHYQRAAEYAATSRALDRGLIDTPNDAT